MASNFVFFEHAMGISLFKIGEFDEVASFVHQIQKNASEISTFSQFVELVAFQPFSSGRDALEYMNNSTEGILLESVKEFLENNLPKSKKKRHVTLGILEPKFATVISEDMGIDCNLNKEIVEEISRGIRRHFLEMVKDSKEDEIERRSQLGLGHHYARCRIKFNVNRIDNMVISSINLVDMLDKDINTFSMRIREWYSFHFPELVKIVPENHLYNKCVELIKDRRDMSEEVKEALETILMDSNKAQNIFDLACSSMGMELAPVDMENVVEFARRVNSLMTKRKSLMEYLKTKMHNVAPNLAALIGEMVGARLIAHAGSLINLAKFPASTVQILGAEKALFRAIKTRGNTPKYGLLYHSSYIGRASKANKGKISRYLANKCSVATRIDCFREEPTEAFGAAMKNQVEDRLKYLDTGELPPKNFEVMEQALSEADKITSALTKERRKSEKREKRRLSKVLDVPESDILEVNLNDQNGEIASSEKKKKKKHKRESIDSAEFEISPKKMKLQEEPTENEMSEKKKKKLKKQSSETEENSQEMNHEEEEADMDPETLRQLKKARKKEKKRLKALQMSLNGTVDDSMNTSDGSMLGNVSAFSNSLNISGDFEEEHVDVKKKKKKKNKHLLEE